MYDIVIGRNEKLKKKIGTEGAIFLGRQYVRMGQTTSLSSNIYLDLSTAHAMLICGKRGGGKSYTMGVIAEGMASLPKEVSKNLSIILLDTMGIYWAMKFPNMKEEILLKNWGLKGKALDVTIFTPFGYFNEYKDQGIPTDIPFSIKPSELDSEDWCMAFDVSPNDPIGVAIERAIHLIMLEKENFSIDDLIRQVRNDDNTNKDTREALVNRLINAQGYGVFDTKGTLLKDLARGGQVTILDVSCYATMPGGWKIKSLVIGLVAKKLFAQRMKSRKDEEFKEVHHSMHYFGDSEKDEDQDPLIWLVIDEAHEFLPVDGRTLASDALITILREGRQPGISLILATQQPGKIHTDVITQSDIVLSHRLTARLDTDALGMLTQSYMREGLGKSLSELPVTSGAALILDDSNERVISIQVRPRFTWHGGSSPTAIKSSSKQFFKTLKELKIQK